MKLSRTDTSRFATWWFTVDHVLLTALLSLLAIGMLLSLAASPAIAEKKGFATYYFVERHIVFATAGALIMIAVSFFSPAGVRRLALAILLLCLAGMTAVLIWGAELNGSRRWLSFAGHSVQPSEFLKPAFVVVIGWLFAEAASRRDMPAFPMALGLWAAAAVLLIAEPDVGQTLLVSMTAGVMYVLAGMPLIGALVLVATGIAGLGLAYFQFSHVHARLDRFFNPGALDNFQVDRAIQSFSEGGLLGRGPGEGTIKSVLPDAHTDFIFAVVAEEYGVLACAVLLAIFATVVLRSLRRADVETVPADRLAIQGLALVFGFQALINMGVNVGLLPAKGMTLPFISAGGSSMLALSVTAGMLLALTRRRAGLQSLKKPRLVPTVARADYERRVGS